MSYCRFGEADVYIFQSGLGLDCCGCSLAPRRKLKEPYVDFFGEKQTHANDYMVFDTAQKMLDHLALHREKGDDVPESVDEAIKKDFPDLNANIATVHIPDEEV